MRSVAHDPRVMRRRCSRAQLGFDMLSGGSHTRDEHTRGVHEVATSVTVGAGGRIVIPAHMRRELRIEPGQRLHVEAVAGRIVLTPLPRDLIGFLTGSLRGGSMLQDLMHEHAQDAHPSPE